MILKNITNYDDANVFLGCNVAVCLSLCQDVKNLLRSRPDTGIQLRINCEYIER